MNHRNGQLGSRLRIDHDVARVEGNVRNADGLRGGDRRADDPFVGGDAQLSLRALAIFHVQAMAEHIRGRVVKQNAQNLVIDHALDEFRGAAQQLLHGENGIGLARHFIENQQRVGLGANALKQARVFDGDGQAAGHQRHDALLIARKVIDLRALDVQHADRLPFDDQRNHQLGPDRSR